MGSKAGWLEVGQGKVEQERLELVLAGEEVIQPQLALYFSDTAKKLPRSRQA